MGLASMQLAEAWPPLVLPSTELARPRPLVSRLPALLPCGGHDLPWAAEAAAPTPACASRASASANQRWRSAFPSVASREELPAGKQEKQFENEKASYNLTVGVKRLNPEDLKPGGPLIPLDEQRQALRNATKHADEELKEDIEAIRKARKKAFEEDEPMPAEEEPETVGQAAHQLMASGDYGDGPPYPIKDFDLPSWRRRGAEATGNEWVVKEVTKLGSGESHEKIRCYEGATEHACGSKPNCSAEDEEIARAKAQLAGGGGAEGGPGSSGDDGEAEAPEEAEEDDDEGGDGDGGDDEGMEFDLDIGGFVGAPASVAAQAALLVLSSTRPLRPCSSEARGCHHRQRAFFTEFL